MIQGLKEDFNYMLYKNKLYGYNMKINTLYLVIKTDKEHVAYCTIKDIPKDIEDHIKELKEKQKNKTFKW